MVVDLDLLYIYLASILTSASASTSEVNISNIHNLLIFQARRLKFCMVVDLDLGLDLSLVLDLDLDLGGQIFK